MSNQRKPSIVFAHGIWADGSCFQKLIPTLRAEGHEVMAAQYGLDTLKGDVAATIRTFGRVGGPIVLVGHSYGGTVITHAGVDPRVAALVYIAALGPDETETSQGQQDKFPKTDVFKYVEVADGRVWMRPDGVACFAGDLSPEEQGVARARSASLRRNSVVCSSTFLSSSLRAVRGLLRPASGMWCPALQPVL